MSTVETVKPSPRSQRKNQQQQQHGIDQQRQKPSTSQHQQQQLHYNKQKQLPQHEQLQQLQSPSVFDPHHFGGRRTDMTGSVMTCHSCEPDNARMSPTKRMVTMENTYQLEPPTVFKPAMIKPLMQFFLQSTLKDKCYDKEKAPQLCTFLADFIRNQVRKLDLPRYKFICEVTIGQVQGQEVIVASRCLWDESRDNSISVSFQSKSLFAVATLYAFNYE